MLTDRAESPSAQEYASRFRATPAPGEEVLSRPTQRSKLTRAERIRLVSELAPELRKAAKKLARRYGVEADDLVQRGREVSWAALEKYDPTRGAFAAFVMKRARGAMLDACMAASKARADQAGAVGAVRLYRKGSAATGASWKGHAEREKRVESSSRIVASLCAEASDSGNPEAMLRAARRRMQIEGAVRVVLADLDQVGRQLLLGGLVEDEALAESARRLGLDYAKARGRFARAKAFVEQRLRAFARDLQSRGD